MDGNGSQKPRIIQVVAIARNGIIGANGQIPWRVPSDLKSFRRLTLGKPVIMGRKTFESIGKPLDKRHNIVVTRQADVTIDGTTVVGSVDAAIAAAGEVEEIAIIGGAEIYRASRALTDRIYLTRIEGSPDGDAVFEPLDPTQWCRTSQTAIEPDPRDEYPAMLEVYDRADR